MFEHPGRSQSLPIGSKLPRELGGSGTPGATLGPIGVDAASGGVASRPSISGAWYAYPISGTYLIRMGDRGRLVIPAELRQRAALDEGTPLTVIETAGGVVLLTRRQLRDRVQADLAGLDLVGELLAERRSDRATEDAS